MLLFKFSVLLSCVLLCSGHHLFARKSENSYSKYDRPMNTSELIRSYGYPAEEFTVKTTDGYLLDLVRIPFGRNSNQQDQFQRNQYQQGHQYQNRQYQSQNQQFQSQESQQGQSQENQQYRSQNHEYASQNQGHQFQNHYSQSQNYQPQSQGAFSNKNYQNQDSSDSDSSSSSSSSSEEDQNRRPPVLLMHGLLSNSDDFVIGGPKEGLAFVLADNGFDVYLGNVRGSRYGRNHAVLNPEQDPAFWKYSWDDMGMKDLPALVDMVEKISKKKQMFYIGNMQGATIFFVMASEKPDYNKKIRGMIALGPLAFMKHTENIMFKLVASKLDARGWLTKNLGPNKLEPTDELMTEGGRDKCKMIAKDQRMCDNVYFLLNGYNSQNLNSTTMMALRERVPAGASSRQIIHFAQLVKSGRFARFDEGYQQKNEESPEEFDLSKITAPITMLYTSDDDVNTMPDVEMLKRKLPNVKQGIRIDRLTNNMDLMFANRVDSMVHETVMRALRNMNSNSGYNDNDSNNYGNNNYGNKNYANSNYGNNNDDNSDSDSKSQE